MNNQFDELAKGLAQSATRRQALRKFGVGLAGMALACFGLASKAEASPACINHCTKQCVNDYVAQGWSKDQATSVCRLSCVGTCGGI